MKFLLKVLGVVLLIIGCSKLQKDDSLGAVTANYSTAEFTACGKLWHGIGICAVEQGSDLASGVNLQVQGYYKGSIVVQSVDCQISRSVRYTNSQLVGGFIQGIANNSCVITFNVNPEYPNQQHQSIVVSGFRGVLRVQVIPKGHAWSGTVVKESGSWVYDWTFNVGEPNPVRIVLDGCGGKFDQTVQPDQNGVVDIKLNDVVSAGIKTCVIDGVVISQTYQNMYLGVVVDIYEPAYVLLPELATKIEDTPDGQGNTTKTLTANGDPTVSVTALDKEYQFSNNATFNNFDDTKPHTLRAFTVKGRSVIGTFNPQTKAFTWVQ